MTTQAQAFKTNYSDVSDLMTALDNADIESTQDWENETTIWTFDDGSIITVSGPEVDVK